MRVMCIYVQVFNYISIPLIYLIYLYSCKTSSDIYALLKNNLMDEHVPVHKMGVQGMSYCDCNTCI